MNSGANCGINVIYSGTVAAAIEAGFLGLPAIAVSLLLRPDVPTDFRRASKFAVQTIKQILDAKLQNGQVASINVPALHAHETPAGIKVVRQCPRPFIDTYEQRTDPRGRSYYWNSSVFTLGESEEDTDVAALREKFITITPLQFDLTHYPVLQSWQKRPWTL